MAKPSSPGSEAVNPETPKAPEDPVGEEGKGDHEQSEAVEELADPKEDNSLKENENKDGDTAVPSDSAGSSNPDSAANSLQVEETTPPLDDISLEGLSMSFISGCLLSFGGQQVTLGDALQAWAHEQQLKRILSLVVDERKRLQETRMMEIAQLNSSLDKARSEKESLASEKANLKGELKKANDDLKSQAFEVVQLTSTNAELSADLGRMKETSQEEKERLVKQVSEALKAKEDAEQRLKTMAKSLTEREALRLKEDGEKAEKVKLQMDSLKSELERNLEIKGLFSDKVTQLRFEREKLTTNITSLKEELKLAQGKIAHFQEADRLRSIEENLRNRKGELLASTASSSDTLESSGIGSASPGSGASQLNLKKNKRKYGEDIRFLYSDDEGDEDEDPSSRPKRPCYSGPNR